MRPLRAAAGTAAKVAAPAPAAAPPSRQSLSFTIDPAAFLFAHGIKLVAARPHTVAELRTKLTAVCLRRRGARAVAAGVAPCDVLVGQALTRLDAASLTGDAEYARWHVDNRARFRPRSRAHLVAELTGKGVERSLAVAAVDPDSHDEVSACVAALRRRGKRAGLTPYGRLDDKTLAYLMRNGFGAATVQAAVARWRAGAGDGATEPLR